MMNENKVISISLFGDENVSNRIIFAMRGAYHLDHNSLIDDNSLSVDGRQGSMSFGLVHICRAGRASLRSYT